MCLGCCWGQEAKGFSAAVVSRLKAECETECDQWMARDLSKERSGYSVSVDRDIQRIAQRGSQVVFAGDDRRE